MTTGHVFIAVSLDGYIARPDGAIDWLEGWPDVGHDYGFAAFMESVDGLVMGRSTFEQALRFSDWPYTKPVIVLSRTMTDADLPSALAGRVRVSDKAPREVMNELSHGGWQRAYIDGGRVIQSFLREGLIDDLVITRLPVVIGSGLPLFGEVTGDVRLAHASTSAFASGFVQSCYRASAA